MQNSKIITISKTDELFRPDLTQLHETPSQLYCIGNTNLLTRPHTVGIVGSRKVSSYGREVTDRLADELARAGAIIVSGLALGVDSIAHRAAVTANKPTIAVLPTGIDIIYPSVHRDLAKQILDTGGLLISEYPEGAPGMRHQFIERNRIIAALSEVLVVTEAAERSGSLHTARFTLELGKTVMAVPGNITGPLSCGTNQLIRSGASPVLETSDVLRELGLNPSPKNIEYYPENEIEEALLSNLREGITHGDELLTLIDISPEQFQTHLTMLEIKGVIYPSGGHWHLK